MPLYSRDRRFSVGWMIGGAVLMLLTREIGGLVVAVLGFHSVLALAIWGFACFAVGGFVIGWKSEGRTILEAGLAGALAAAVTFLYLFGFRHVLFTPVAIVISGVLPFGAGILGGWLGELVQGDLVESDEG